MITKLIFLYDSTIEPWDANVGRIKTQLANLKERGIDYEVIHTATITEDELDNWRDKAYLPSVRWKLRIRQVFGSRSRGGLPYFGKQVPALLVYEEDNERPNAVYPHQKTYEHKRVDVSIEDILDRLLSERM